MTTTDMSRKKTRATDSVEVKGKDKALVLDINKKFEFSDLQNSIVNSALNDARVILIDGGAGTSKTFLSVYCALKLLFTNRVDEIFYIRAAVELGQSLGSLPGEIDEKFSPFVTPLIDKMDELLGRKEVDTLLGTGLSTKPPLVHAMPINYIRGSDWKYKCIIGDEAQNMTKTQLITLLTRISHKTKMFLIGDSMQIDIKNSGWKEMLSLFSDYQSEEHGIYSFRFTEEDVVRDPLVKFMIGKLNGTKPTTAPERPKDMPIPGSINATATSFDANNGTESSPFIGRDIEWSPGRT